jgi:hypothetical protein
MISHNDVIFFVVSLTTTFVGGYIFTKKKKSIVNVFIFGIIIFIVNSIIFYMLFE